MKLQTISRFPAAPDVVFRMLCDPNFHTRKLEEQGLSGKFRLLGSGQDGDEFFTRMERKLPMAVPGSAKGESAIVSEERWNPVQHTGTLKFETAGMPVSVTCQADAQPDGETTVIRFNWLIESSIPVLGASIEKFLANDITKRSGQETKAGLKLLDDYR